MESESSTNRPILNLTPRRNREELAPLRQRILDAFPVKTVSAGLRESYLIMNRSLQIIVANRAFCELSGIAEESDLLGIRIGEAIGCSNCDLQTGGCGTGKECGSCRILHGLSTLSRPEEEEAATLFRSNGEALHFKISVSPFVFEDEEYLAVTLRLVSHEERKSALERIFYHDILNSAGVLKGLIELLNEHYADKGDIDPEARDIWKATLLSSSRIVEEIQAQRDISKAERNELRINPLPTDTGQVIDELIDWFTAYELAKEGQLQKSDSFQPQALITDSIILRRVLINLIKNALEASPRGARVFLDSAKTEGRIRLSVVNPGVIDTDVQRRLFRQTFSTKGRGRGFGTYSVKLLTEQYLKGSAGFVSNEEEQTRFYIELPRSLA